ncbi:MAG: NADH-quinone oxidoreductase subunit NuoK [Bacteroidetes bacterium]|nr:NADH-quinone oxidoreductase subunit NuoK [Bacteroidota bacterium]
MAVEQHILIFSILLFCAGIGLTLLGGELIRILIGIELMLNSANLNLVWFTPANAAGEGSTIALFILVISVCEAAVGLAVLLRVYRYYRTSSASEINQIRE